MTRFAQRLAEYAVAPRKKVRKGKLLQLAVAVVQAQAVRNGCVNVQRLLGGAPPLGAVHITEGAHVVCAIGQFDQNHTHIAGHGKQHFAKRLCLCFFSGVEVQLVQFGQAVYQLSHRAAKTLHNFALFYAAVFYRVVQQSRHEGLGVQLPAGTLGGHRDGVGDVGLAVFAFLAQMRFVCKAVRSAQVRHIGGVEVVNFCHQRGEAGGRGIGCIQCCGGR